jgi:hypothetical protein
MDRVIHAPLFAAAWLVGMLLLMELGRRAGVRRLAKDPSVLSGLGPIEGAVFGLLGLLIAFTFSEGALRLDSRRQLIAEEAENIGTAYLRLDLLPADAQPALRTLFRDYLDSRLAVYRKLPDLDAAKAELARSEGLQHEIWTQSVAATREPGGHPDAARLLLPSLNNMIDITTTRTMAARIHPPPIIYALLFFLGLACSLLAGYGMAEGKLRSWMHMLGFTIIMFISLYVILTIEYPRMSFLHFDVYDQVLVDLRGKMK